MLNSLEKENLIKRLEIETEIGRMKNEYNKSHSIANPNDDSWFQWVFMNFFSMLPGGWRRKVYTDEILDKPWEELGAQKTTRQFFEELETVTMELGSKNPPLIDLNELVKLQLADTNHTMDRNITSRTINQIAIPVYVEMRLRGYSHKALTS